MEERGADVVEVGLYWGGTLLAVHRLKGDGVLTLGDSEGASFRVSDPRLPGRVLPFARRAGDRLHLYIFAGMEVRTERGHAGPDAVTLLPAETAEVTLGALVFRVRWTAGTRRIPVALLATLDLLFSKVLSASLVAQAAVVAALLLTPDFALDDDLDLWRSATAWITAPTATPARKMPPVVEVRTRPTPVEKATTFGQQVARRPSRTSVRVSEREQATDAANRALALLGLEGSRGGRGPGLLDAAAASIQQLRGTGIGAGDGPGLGTRGSGPGGGGGALSIGPVGSPGGAGGDGDGVDLCAGGPCKGKSRVELSAERTLVKGGLSKDEIQRVVSRHLSQIRHCYERQLTRDPNLSGKLFLFWTIAPSGAVASANVVEDTLGDPDLRQCVMRIVTRMSFPKPRGGGTVDVRYPFVFAPG